MSLFDYLERDRRPIFLVLLILCFLPVLFPLNLPVNIEYWTSNTYGFVESLQPGDVVVMPCDIGGATVAELYPGYLAIAKHVLAKDLRMVIMTFNAVGQIMVEQTIIDAGWQAAVDRGEKVYGVDFVALPYIAGFEAAFAQFAQDTHSTVNVDIYGNKIEDLPLMDDVHSFRDVKFVAFASASMPDPHMRQWTPYIDTTGFCYISLGYFFSSNFVFLRSGQWIGFINGVKGAAEYEILAGFPGRGLTFMDQSSVTHLYAIALLILGNAVAYRARTRARSEVIA